MTEFAERIALLIESDGPGGAEQVVAHLARGLAAEGVPVTVFVPADGEGWLAARLRGAPVEVAALPLGGPASARASVALRRALRRRQIALLHTHEFGQSLVGAVAARSVGIPHLITMHGGTYYAERWRRRAALRLAIALSGSCTAVSITLAAEIERHLGLSPGTVQLVPNGAAPAPVGRQRLREVLGIPTDARLLLAVGNLYPVKGHRVLLSAVAALSERHPALHLAIAGRGAEEVALLDQARREGTSSRLHLLGLRDDIGTLLQDADLFVHPSFAEGAPLAVIEAMLAARPIVATAVGEVPSLLAGGEAGRLVPPDDPAALAAAIDGILHDRIGAERMAAFAATRAETSFGSAGMVGRYRTLYRSLFAVEDRSARDRPEQRLSLREGQQ